ncbi:MAG: antibiotic biosynthesis monooxygenase [Acidobacteriota bacterium]
MADSPSDALPVTVVIRRRIHPDRQEEFERWLEGILAAASRFQGYLGARVLKPTDVATQDYVLLLQYVTPEDLERWETSDERAEWLAKVEPLTLGETSLQRATGLEFWFKLPDDAARKPPPRWKMVIVTLIAIYPLILFLVPALAKLLAHFPPALAALTSTLTLVILMTYVVMPTLTRILCAWLYPTRGKTDAPNSQ